MSAAVASVDEQLAWERRQGPRAAAAAFLGALLTVAGGFVTGIGLGDSPSPSVLRSLPRLEGGQPIGGQRSLRLEQFDFFADHRAAILISAIVLGLGALAAAGALTYLAYATRARAERFPRPMLYVAFVGGALTLIGSVLSALGNASYVDAILGGPGTVDAIRDASQPASLYAGSIIRLIGGLAVALAYVLIPLNAMRAGLLTRFLGILGILAGVLTVLPVLAAPILQPFWLAAIGVLFLGRWPGAGVPPAWRSGKAEPWPSAAEVRQQKLAARGGKSPASGRKPQPVPAEEVEQRAAKVHPSSKKRKRKRRG